MQISILSLMLAFGLPGANSCSAQQQGLPRVGQTPPAVTDQADSHPAAEKPDADDDADAPEAPEAREDEGGAMAESAEAAAEAGAAMAESNADEADEAPEPMEFEFNAFGSADKAPACPGCEAKCEGQGVQRGTLGWATSTRTPDGYVVYGQGQGGTLTLDGKVVHLNEQDLQKNGQTVTIEPGSTVILETKNGKKVVLRPQGGAEMRSFPLAMPGMLSMKGMSGMAQAAPQSQDGRVRELEQRVRELEAALRERDGRSRNADELPRTNTPEAQDPFADDHARGKAMREAERERAHEMRERMSQQAREMAEQARKQAADVRKQAEIYREQARAQAQQWRAYAEDWQNQNGWKVRIAPQAGQPPMPAPNVLVAPEPPDAPEPAIAAPKAEPAQPPAGAFRMRAPRAAQPPPPAHVQEMHAMLEEMKTQMQELREQMQALRDELQNAPKHDMR